MSASGPGWFASSSIAATPGDLDGGPSDDEVEEHPGGETERDRPSSDCSRAAVLILRALSRALYFLRSSSLRRLVISDWTVSDSGVYKAGQIVEYDGVTFDDLLMAIQADSPRGGQRLAWVPGGSGRCRFGRRWAGRSSARSRVPCAGVGDSGCRRCRSR